MPFLSRQATFLTHFSWKIFQKKYDYQDDERWRTVSNQKSPLYLFHIKLYFLCHIVLRDWKSKQEIEAIEQQIQEEMKAQIQAQMQAVKKQIMEEQQLETQKQFEKLLKSKQ